VDIKEALNEAVAAVIPPASSTPVSEPEDVKPVLTEEPADAPDDAVEAADAEDQDGETEAPVLELPEGYVAVPSVTEGLATEFVLSDAEGEVEVPALVVTYKANGKVRHDRLDQVVKLAQWGVYNQEREQVVRQEVAQEKEQLVALVREREAQMERLLTDEDFLETIREGYLQENSAERRAERAESEVKNLQVQQQLASITESGERFYTNEILPAVQMIMDALPNVSMEEIAPRLEMVMQAHAELAPNGKPYVSPSRYDAIRQYIVDDLALWAQAVHTRRSQTSDAGKAGAELERARVEAQKAKRVVGQTLKPVGQAARDTSKPKAQKPATIDDAVHSALSAVLSSI